MLYFKVKPQYDNFQIYISKEHVLYIGHCLIGNELFTEKEWLKITKNAVGDLSKCVEKTEIKKNKTYFFFGARFSEE